MHAIDLEMFYSEGGYAMDKLMLAHDTPSYYLYIDAYNTRHLILETVAIVIAQDSMVHGHRGLCHTLSFYDKVTAKSLQRGIHTFLEI